MLIELLHKNPSSQTQQQLPAEAPSWSDTFVPSEVYAGEDEFISRRLTMELDNIIEDNNFLKSMVCWDDEEDIQESF